MTKPIHPQKSKPQSKLPSTALHKRRFLKLGMVLGLSVAATHGLSACNTTIELPRKSEPMNPKKPSLWQAINALSNSGLSKTGVNAALSTSLSEVRRTPHTVFFEGGDVALADELKIAKIDLRLSVDTETNSNNTPPEPGFLVINIEGHCVFLNEIEGRYSALKITERPRGRSADEATVYTSTQPWGALSFGFKEERPQCLDFVVFAPNKVV
jgi:hypothetical protein